MGVRLAAPDNVQVVVGVDAAVEEGFADVDEVDLFGGVDESMCVMLVMKKEKRGTGKGRLLLE